MTNIYVDAITTKYYREFIFLNNFITTKNIFGDIR